MKTPSKSSESLCPACIDDNTKNFSYFNKPQDIELRYCNSCQLIYKSKDSNNAVINVEQGEYYALKKVGSKVNKRYIKHFTRRSKDHYIYIEKYFPQKVKKSVLDIGCGAGFFISYLKSKGWEVNGIEPDPLMYNYATHSLELPIEKTTFSEWKKTNKYGLIYLSHVIDDLPDLNDVAVKIKDSLEPDGILFIEVPNFSWPFRLTFEKKEDLYINKYFFSSKSLSSFLEKNDFTVLDIKTFHLVHLNTIFQRLISPVMLLMKLKPKKYRPYLRIIAKKNA